MSASYFDQHDYDVRCEWGLAGLQALAPSSDVVIIVDVLSFSTCVDIAVGNGAVVYPFRLEEEAARAHAQSLGALLAGKRRTEGHGYSLSPASLLTIPPGTRLVLPSPNGSTLSHAAGAIPTVAGCPRNARAVATAAVEIGQRIAVIPAGERWPDGSLRPTIEDWLGAGAIIAQLPGRRSPEAQLAAWAFEQARDSLADCLSNCGSGRELTERGFAEDVRLAAALNVSDCAPIMRDGGYTAITAVPLQIYPDARH